MDKKTTQKSNKENTTKMSVQKTNQLFSCITLFVVCLTLLGIGLFLMIAYDAVFAGIFLIILSSAFTGLNIFLNFSLFSKKKDKSNDSTKALK